MLKAILLIVILSAPAVLTATPSAPAQIAPRTIRQPAPPPPPVPSPPAPQVLEPEEEEEAVVVSDVEEEEDEVERQREEEYQERFMNDFADATYTEY